MMHQFSRSESEREAFIRMQRDHYRRRQQEMDREQENLFWRQFNRRNPAEAEQYRRYEEWFMRSTDRFAKRRARADKAPFRGVRKNFFFT